MNKILEKFKSINKLKVILFLFIILCFFISLFNKVNCDEIEGIHTGWKILNNGNIYIDFFQHHNPFSYYLWAFVVKIFGESIAVIYIARIITFVMFLFILKIFYKISFKLFNNEDVSLISILMVLTLDIFMFGVLHIRPDTGQILFSLLSFYFLLNYFENKKIKNLILSSISIALSFLFLQKAILFLGLIGFLFLYQVFILKNVKFRYGLLYLFIFIFSLSPYYFYLLYNGFFEKYYIMNWVLNSKFIVYTNLFVSNVTTSFIRDSYFWIFIIIGTAQLLKDKIKNSYFIIISSFYLFFSLIFLNTPHRYYFIIPILFLSVIASYGLNSLIKNRNIIIYIFIFLLFTTSFNFIFRTDHNFGQMETLKDLNSEKLVARNEYVFDGFPAYNLFRNDINYFWFSVHRYHALKTYQKYIDNNYEFNIYKLLEEYKPKIISIWYPFPSNSNPTIMIDIENEYVKNNYKPLEGSKYLYIRKNDK